jgi:hypothetical protein
MPLPLQANQVGTVVKTAEDDDPIAVMSVLNTQRHAAAPFMPQILEYITSKCSDASVKQQLQQAWSAPGTGLLLNERLVNSPPQIAPPLVTALFEEIDQAAGDTTDKVDTGPCALLPWRTEPRWSPTKHTLMFVCRHDASPLMHISSTSQHT